MQVLSNKSVFFLYNIVLTFITISREIYDITELLVSVCDLGAVYVFCRYLDNNIFFIFNIIINRFYIIGIAEYCIF